jgi:hypothetical protein
MDLNQLLPTSALPTAQSAAVAQLVRLVAGDLSQLPAGQALPATVVKTTPGETVLSVGGQQLTVKGELKLPPGEVLTVRVQPGAKPTLAIVGPPETTPTGPQPTVRGQTSPPGPQPTVRGQTSPTGPQPTVRGQTSPTGPDSQGRGGVQGGQVTALPPGANERADGTRPTTPRGEPGSGGVELPPSAETVGRGVRSEPAVSAPQPQRTAVTAYRTPAPISTESVVVDVIAREPDGRLRVTIDGRETTATSPQPLAPGGRYVVQVERTPAGVVLRPLPDSPRLTTAVATAILRTDKPPPIGESLPSLVKELSALPADATVRPAATQVKELAVQLLPSPDEPPTAERIKQLVEDGGTHFEAKLARAAESPEVARPAPHTDLKSGLLSLARTVTDLSAAFPAAAATLDGIERQQAVNVLAQQSGGMAVFHIPFPDGPHWRTLGLGIEPDRTSTPDAAGRPTAFRVMMHVPLTALGETWIDASAESSRLRAVLYVSDAEARERVRAELPDLRGELRAGGFGEVLLDVRPAADLTDAQRRTANAVREGVPAGGGLLDVQA